MKTTKDYWLNTEETFRRLDQILLTSLLWCFLIVLSIEQVSCKCMCTRLRMSSLKLTHISEFQELLNDFVDWWVSLAFGSVSLLFTYTCLVTFAYSQEIIITLASKRWCFTGNNLGLIEHFLTLHKNQASYYINQPLGMLKRSHLKVVYWEHPYALTSFPGRFFSSCRPSVILETNRPGDEAKLACFLFTQFSVWFPLCIFFLISIMYFLSDFQFSYYTS